jgi:hypothetical protein
MGDDKLKEVLKLLRLQKEALTELTVELMANALTPSATSRAKAGVSAQKAIIFRTRIEQQVRKLVEQQS